MSGSQVSYLAPRKEIAKEFQICNDVKKKKKKKKKIKMG